MHSTVYHFHVTHELQSEYTLYSFPECQGSPGSKLALHLKFRSQQRDLNPEPLILSTNNQPFHQTHQMIEQCCEIFSVWWIWLHAFTMSRKNFTVNPHSIVCLNVKELLVRSRHHIWNLGKNNETSTQTHLICKRTLNHLAKLAKWLRNVVTTYVYSVFDCILFSSHVRVLESTHTLYFAWMWRNSLLVAGS